MYFHSAVFVLIAKLLSVIVYGVPAVVLQENGFQFFGRALVSCVSDLIQSGFIKIKKATRIFICMVLGIDHNMY
ncbi:hypothetical protein PU02_0643 [Bartonella ancashensis]|uniref:Uncharacterized protein n=1 Tax=Bartonella ancashensis TaxID=1318743 RepID=A0A0M4LGB7_9HYPH|nr:hypothetical protein PU02_0643 [Bartonella ancashensis]